MARPSASIGMTSVQTGPGKAASATSAGGAGVPSLPLHLPPDAEDETVDVLFQSAPYSLSVVVLPPGSTACVCGHLPPSVPSARTCREPMRVR